jgi:hypothetical protein
VPDAEADGGPSAIYRARPPSSPRPRISLIQAFDSGNMPLHASLKSTKAA